MKNIKYPTLAELEPRLHYIAEKICKMEEEKVNKQVEEEQRIALLIYESISNVFNHRHANSETCEGCVHNCPMSLQFKKIHDGHCNTKFVW